MRPDRVTRQAVVVGLVLCLAPTCAFSFGQPDGDWSRLADHLGQTVLVTATDRSMIRGALAGVSDTALSLRENRSERTLDRIEVCAVILATSKRARRVAYVSIFSVVGLVAGVLAALPFIDDSNSPLYVGGAVGTGIGAIVGSAFDGSQQTLLFRSPASSCP